MSKAKVKFAPTITTEYTSKTLKKGLKYYNKSLGIKLTKKNIKTKELSKQRKKLETGIHNSLIGVNCIVGGVPIRLKQIDRKKIKRVKNFTKKSTLDYSAKRYVTNDIMFRRKVIVLCTSKIIKNEKKILNRLSKPYVGRKEYEKFRIVKDHEFFATYVDFVLNMLGDTPNQTDNLFDIYYLLNKKDISREINKQRFKVLKDMTKSYNHIFGRKKSYKLITDVFNMALLLGSGEIPAKRFTYKDFKGCTVEDDLGKMIQKLGRKIIKSGVSEMFLIYLQCNPKVRTMYIKEVREGQNDVIVGLLALAFTDYMFHQLNIHYIIRLLLRRPWAGENEKSNNHK